MKLVKLLTTAGLAAGLILAQRGPRPMGGPGGTPPDPAKMIQMRVDRLATALSLTDAQKTQITQIFTNAESAAQNYRTASENNRTQLQDAIKKNDTAGIDQAAMALGTASGQLSAIQGKAEAAVYALLTPEQKAQYDQMPHGGPGGMGGGPMGPMGGFGRQGRPSPRQ